MLRDLLDVARVALSLRVPDKDSALRAIAELLVEPEGTLDTEAVYDVLARREALASTGVGSGVAIPHGRIAGIEELRVALMVQREGVPFDAVDQLPVRIIVGILGPEDAPRKHLGALAHVSRALRDESVRTRLCSASEPAEARRILIEV